MKKAAQLSLFLFLLAGTLCARVFLVGSNPYLSIFAFPQDVFLTHGDYAYAYTTYTNLPWWGDIDDPEHRPDDEYLSVKGSISGEDGQSFQHKSSADEIKQMIGFARGLSQRAKMRLDLEYQFKPMKSEASGSLLEDDGSQTAFDYKQKINKHHWYLKSLLGMHVGEVPLGVRIGFGVEHTTERELDYKLNRKGEEYSLTRKRWAWSESGSARFQDSYALGPLYRFDAQIAATLPRLKIGTRFRYNFGNLNQWYWDDDTSALHPDPVIDEYFDGRYTQGDSKKISNKTVRLYGNYTWIKRDKFRFNTLALTRYTHVDSIGVVADNDDAYRNRDERSRTFVLQINPNVNIYPWDLPMCYLDAAILCNYQHMSYDFLREHWVSGGGQVEGYADTRVHVGKDYPWHNFSYGKENFFEVALDLNPVLPLYGNKRIAVAAGINMLLWTRFMWFNKYYGTTDNSGEFQVENIRKNFDRETWLHSALSLTFRVQPYTFRIQIAQPLIYNLLPRTRVYEADGETLLYEYRREAMWLSESGVKLGLFFSTDLQTLGSLADQIRNR